MSTQNDGRTIVSLTGSKDMTPYRSPALTHKELEFALDNTKQSLARAERELKEFQDAKKVPRRRALAVLGTMLGAPMVAWASYFAYIFTAPIFGVAAAVLMLLTVAVPFGIAWIVYAAKRFDN